MSSIKKWNYDEEYPETMGVADKNISLMYRQNEVP